MLVGLHDLGDHDGIGGDALFGDPLHLHAGEDENVVDLGVAQAGEVEVVGEPVLGN